MTETARLDGVATAPLAGRRALVTGGSRGIGAGIVRRLAADGAAVAFTYREAKGPANDLEQEIVGSGGIAMAIQADSADPEALRAAIADTVGRFGGLEVLAPSPPLRIRPARHSPDVFCLRLPRSMSAICVATRPSVRPLASTSSQLRSRSVGFAT